MSTKYIFLLLILSNSIDILSMDYDVSGVQKYQLLKQSLETKQHKIQKKLAHDKNNSDLSDQLEQTNLTLYRLEYEQLTSNQLKRNQSTIQQCHNLIKKFDTVTATVLNAKIKEAYKKVLTTQLQTTSLFEHIRNNKPIPQELLDSCTMEAEDEQHNTLLHYAAQYQNPAAVKIILDAIRIPDQVDAHEFEYFMQQLQIQDTTQSLQNSPEIKKPLLSNNDQDNNPEQLFQNNIINRPNNQGETPYQIAKKYNNVVIMKLLRDNDAEIPVEEIKQNDQSLSATQKSYKSKKKKKQTINGGTTNNKPKQNAPFSSEESEELDGLMQQIDNAPSVIEEMVLDAAILTVVPKEIKQLFTLITNKRSNNFAKNLAAMEKNQFKLTPPLATYLLRAACQNDDVKSANLLLEKDANPNFSKTGTPLVYAIMNNNKVLVQSLIMHRTDVNHQDIHGNTPLHQAVNLHKHNDKTTKEIITLLLDNGADINIENSDGKTPLQLTIEQTLQCHDKTLFQLFVTMRNLEDGESLLNILGQKNQFGVTLAQYINQHIDQTPNRKITCQSHPHVHSISLH